VLLVVYVLSTGPVILICSTFALPEQLLTVYAPLGFVATHCEPAEDALIWYARLWGANVAEMNRDGK